MCGRVYPSSEWSIHRAVERRYRVGRKKPALVAIDGVYKCFVANCPYTGSRHYTAIRRHMMTHSKEEIESGGSKLEVRTLIITDLFIF